ncbi:MAG TPA: tRNA lysidine(34) synthetase TilS, partial [Burkholderiaceae bacterium]|nr:tRNA lysidine(34) synthetase TilS [Burkholderiaceae bacterium]
LPVRHVHGLPVLRPLLDSRRAELAEYARREGLQWVEDPSNDDPRFARNRLRRQGREALPDDEVTRLHAEAERARAEWERIERAAVADVEAAMVGGVPGVPGVSGASGASGGSSVLGGGSVPGGGGTGGESSESSRNGGLVGLCGLGGCDRIGRHLAAAPGGGEAVAGVPPFIGPLDRGVLRSLPRERCVWALREWAGRFGLPPPSRAQTDQLMRQLVDGPASDAEVVVRDVALLRHRDRLFGLRGAAAARRLSAAAAALEPVALRDLPAVEQGSDVTIIELPAGVGRLHVRTDPSDPLSGLRVAGGGQGGWRLRPEAGRPSRTLKNLYQEAGVPAWLRPLYPVVLAGADVVYSAALGHGVPAAGRAHASWSSPILGWEPADDDDLAALLRWHAAAIAAPAAGPAR